jgi:hypothetical protein
MNVFGENRAVRLAFFEEGSMPSKGQLKQIFNSQSVRTYKGWGSYSHEIHTISQALHVEARLRGSTYGHRLSGCEFAILDASSAYTVFTVAKYLSHLIATISWSPALSDRIERLLRTISSLEYEYSLSSNFVRGMERMKALIATQGLRDELIESFDSKAFASIYENCGQHHVMTLKKRIADEAPNIYWTADNPAYEGSEDDEQEPEAKAA